MFIRLLSDIHLELSTNANKLVRKLISSVSLRQEDSLSPMSVLVLAGDIGNPSSKIYKLFIREMAKYHDQVFVVAGNHEYYQSAKRHFDPITNSLGPRTRLTMDQINELITLTTDSLPNVHFLNQKSVVFNRTRFLGCTLWTRSNPRLSKYMNDYNFIPGMTPVLCEELHNNDVTWLSEELDRESKEFDQTVVITHHLPSYQLISEKYQGNPTNSFYATNLEELVKKADIWCCGHSHTAKQVTIGECRCYLNPVGYSQEFTGFKDPLWIDVSLIAERS